MPPKAKSLTTHIRRGDSKQDPAVDFPNRELFLLYVPNSQFYFTVVETLKGIVDDAVDDDAVDEDSLDMDLEEFLELFEEYLKGDPSAFETSNISRLCLFYGPPGTGKSRQCKIMARKMVDIYTRLRESGELAEVFERDSDDMRIYFHGVTLGNLTNSMIGRTEKNMEDVLYHIPKRFGISIIFLEEVDSVLGYASSGGESAQLKDQVTKSFQALVEGGVPQLEPNTFVVATTNKDVSQMSSSPWVGRFGTKTYVSPPKSAAKLGKVVQTFWRKNTYLHQLLDCAKPNQSSVDQLHVDPALLERLVDAGTVPRDVENMMTKMSQLRVRRKVAERKGLEIACRLLSTPEEYFDCAALEFLKDKQQSVENAETLEESHSSGQKRYHSFLYCCEF
jgi:SpoVK/Ycf46/Vps4 family AAA+-type ATPase